MWIFRTDGPPRRSYIFGLVSAGTFIDLLRRSGDGGEANDRPESGLPPGIETDGAAIAVSQVGYRPADRKVGYVRTDASAFRVYDIESEEQVLQGEVSSPVTDEASGDTVRKADFSRVNAEGTYVLTDGDGTVASHPFRVADGVWEQPLGRLCRQYTLRRSHTAVEDSVTGLSIEPGHPQDRRARLYFGDTFHDEGERIDVRGGWYDAGDYGKYVPTAAVTVAQLLLAHELNPESIPADYLSDSLLPEGSTDAEPDLLSEVRFELRWLERMQRPDGAVYHKVAGREWPGYVRPAADTQPRYVFGVSTYGTGLYTGVMAIAARVYRPFDPEFADRLLDNARSGMGFLMDTPEPVFRHDPGQDAGSGAYRKDTDGEERFWAAAELFRTTAESTYERYLERTVPEYFTTSPGPPSWANGLLFGQWAYHETPDATPERRRQVARRITAGADAVLDRISESAYNVSLTPNEWTWGSNRRALSKGVHLVLANEIDPTPDYMQGALDQVRYVTGSGPTGGSFVTGVGAEPPADPHDRLAVSTGVTIPGSVVGGPNEDGGDEVLASLIDESDPAPAECYVDDHESYASNEPAVDYAAPLAFVLAAV